MTRPSYAVVNPTIGRPGLARLVATVDGDLSPSSIVVAELARCHHRAGPTGDDSAAGRRPYERTRTSGCAERAPAGFQGGC
jgi:hypothetical protein